MKVLKGSVIIFILFVLVTPVLSWGQTNSTVNKVSIKGRKGISFDDLITRFDLGAVAFMATPDEHFAHPIEKAYIKKLARKHWQDRYKKVWSFVYKPLHAVKFTKRRGKPLLLILGRPSFWRCGYKIFNQPPSPLIYKVDEGNYPFKKIKLRGDFDDDGDVDDEDIAFIYHYENKPAKYFPEGDLDKDGIITKKDAEKMVSLCSRAKCGVEKKKRCSIIGKPTIDGRNHDMEGNLLPDSSVPGLATNLPDSSYIRIRHTEIYGNPKEKFGMDYVDVSEIIDSLKDKADITITEDTVYEGGTIGSKDDPKIVVVDGASLTLKEDFKGYGVLILTGERKLTPLVFPDEYKKGRIDKKTIHDYFIEIRSFFHQFLFPSLRRATRLVMDDDATWYGVVISDVGVDVARCPWVKMPIIILGRQQYPFPPIIRVPLEKFHLKWEKFKSSIKDFIEGISYAAPKVDIFKKSRYQGDEDRYKRYKKDRYKRYKKEVEKKEYEIFLRRWPISKKRPVSKPARERARIYGSVLLGGQYAVIKMASADILYCREALKMIDEEISSRRFIWEEYKEEK